jgi:hypothetical protein
VRDIIKELEKGLRSKKISQIFEFDCKIDQRREVRNDITGIVNNI